MFGASKPTAFGTAFGSGPVFGTSTPFATPASTSAFGSTAFGSQTPASTGGLFGNTSNTGGLFGQTNTFGQQSSGGFAFGSTPSTSGGLFGQNTQASSVFSTPNTFGTTNALGGFGTSGTASVFGNQNQPTAGGASIFASSVFGNSTMPNGTTVKFAPVAGTDSIVKNGLNTNINTKHQCITAMKEYEPKCLEELRWDDYQANRKGKQQTALFGTTPAAGTSAFGAFGQPTSTFGTSTGFGATSGTTGGLFGNTQTTNTGGLFGQPKPLFGAATTTSQSSFSFGTMSTPSMFGQPQQQQTTSLFGMAASSAPATGGLFGNTSSFGNTSAFNFNSGTAQSGGLFGTKTTTFGASAAPALFGNTASTGTNLFNKPATNTFSFGTPASSSTGFGASTGGNLFGAKPTGFGTATSGIGGGTNLFGNTLGTGFGTTSGTGSIFGNTAKPTFTGFGNTGTAFGGLGGGQPTSTTFSFANQSTAPIGGNADAMLALQQAQIQQHLAALSHSPYGDSPLFWNLKSSQAKQEELLKPTNPLAQKAALNQYKVSPGPSNKLKPKPRTSLLNSTKAGVFDNTADDDFAFGNNIMVPRKSIKKLVIRNNNNRSSATEDDTILMNGPPMNGYTNDVLQENTRNDRGTPFLPQTIDVSSQQRQDQLDDTIPYYTQAAPNSQEKHSVSNSLEESVVSQEEYSDNPTRDAPPHPTGIVMTRPGYYTIPPLDELTNMMDANGDIFVENFTIGRHNYGSVFFYNVTNVAGLNIDQLVHIRRKEIIVYPDDDAKPELGQGLNKPAEVTLECVWPTDKTHKKPITSPERLNLMKYAEKIERSTVKIGAKFIDYRPETGSWVFQVKHFSKYALADDTDDEELPEPERKRHKSPPPTNNENTNMSISQTAIQDHVTQSHTNGDIPLGLKDPLTYDTITPGGLSHDSVEQNLQTYHTDSQDEGLTKHVDTDEQMTDDDEDDVITGMIEAEMDDKSGTSNEMEPEPNSHRLATNLGLLPRDVQTMKASLFDSVEHMDVFKPGLSSLPLRGSQSDIVLSPQLASNHKGQAHLHNLSSLSSRRQKYTTPLRPSMSLLDNSKDTSVIESFKARSRLPNYDHLIVPNGLLYEKPSIPSAVSLHVTESLPPLDQSLTYRSQHLLYDAGMFMGRSFRVGWGPENMLVHSGHAVSATPMDTPMEGKFSILQAPSKDRSLKSPWQVTIERVDITQYANHDIENLIKHHVKLMEIQLQNSVQHTIADGLCPLYTPREGVSALHNLAHYATETTFSGMDAGTMNHMRSVWQLCIALWGNIPGFAYDDYIDDKVYAHHQARREAVTKWLKTVLSDNIPSITPIEKPYLLTVLSLLSKGNILEARNVAQRHCDHRLALLITQSCGAEYPCRVLAKQLLNWAEFSVDEYISTERLKIYAMLANQLVWISSESTINCCEGLDWKRSLAVHLWFGCHSNSTISEVLNLYDSSFSGDSSHGKYAVAPLPPYLEQEHNTNTEQKKSDVFLKDTCYHLLKLYTERSYNFARVVCPVASTANQLDYRLSWHLCNILLCLGYSHISESKLRSLHTSYASQLEALGLWHWAIFVLMHIQNPHSRRDAVMQVLNRNICLSTQPPYSEKEVLVEEKLGVPTQWIHHAKALCCKYANLHEREAWHLIKAQQWSRAHVVILQYLAPDAIINDELDFLMSYLGELSPSDRCVSIKDWTFQGGVYVDYVNVLRTLNNIAEDCSNVYDLERLEPQISSLCFRVSNLPCPTAKHRLCQLEMSKRAVNVLRTLISLQQQIPPDRISISMLAPYLNELPMSDDYMLQDLQPLTSTPIINYKF